MGTNFYWIEPAPKCHQCGAPQGEPREGEHIGKRSAAGLYCWDCDVTLCAAGNARIHYGSGDEGWLWLKTCPRCGKTPDGSDAGLKSGAAAVELGFAAPREGRPSGVCSTASFSWAQPPLDVRQRCEANFGVAAVRDEYGRTLTGGEFLRMLRANCAVEFTDSIGRAFS